MIDNSKVTNIPCRLHNVGEGGVAGADEVIDDLKGKTQQQINAEVEQTLGDGGSVDKRIAGAVNVEKTRAEGAESALDGRVDTLEEAVGTGGSVDSRISSAVSAEATRAQAAEADRYTKSETYTKEEVNNLITTPSQEYVSVTATDQTTSVTDVLPATGAADTTYRVGNWDGTQYNDSVFSEYAWNGSAYIKLSTKSQIGEVYDISANHAGATYADLSAALGTNGANIPQSLRRGGMSVKFVLTSDNKYVQYRLMSDTFNTTTANWQGVDAEPTVGSDNLVKSGGVAANIHKVSFPVLSFIGKGATSNDGVPSDGIMLAFHHYRIYPKNIDISGLSIPDNAGLFYVYGYDKDGVQVNVYTIRKSSSFSIPEYVDYVPTTDVYNLTLGGKSIVGANVIAVIEELGKVVLPLNDVYLEQGSFDDSTSDWATNETPSTVRLRSICMKAGDVELECNDGYLFAVVYGNIGQQNVWVDYAQKQKIEKSMGYVRLLVKKSNGDVLNTEDVTIKLAFVSKNEAFEIIEDYNLGHFNAGKIIFEQGGFDDNSTWATNEVTTSIRCRTKLMKADDAIVVIPQGYLISAVYGTPGNSPTFGGYKSGSLVITKSMNYVRFLLKKQDNGNVTPDEFVIKTTLFANNLLCNSLNFPVMGCGTKLVSLPQTTYTHIPVLVETDNYIFAAYHSCETSTVESLDNPNDVTLCIINKYTGEQWYETIFSAYSPDVINGNNCSKYHNFSMIDTSSDEVLISVGCICDNKWIFINKTYNAATKALSGAALSTISFGGNEVPFNLYNYISMLNSKYGLSITLADKVANEEDIWEVSKYIDDNDNLHYIGLVAIKTNSEDNYTPWVMMQSDDAKNWEPLFMLFNDKEASETQVLVANNKCFIVTRTGGSFATPDKDTYGSFYCICDMSGNIVKEYTKLNAQRTKPCEIFINEVLYIIYNKVGAYSGKYWGRTKVSIAKLNVDNTITDVETYESPYGINYPFACNHNGALLMAYLEDSRGFNGTIGQNAITDLAIAQIFV